MIYCAFKTELKVNNKQQTLFLQHLGCARWAFNWALAKKKEAFDKKEKIPSSIDLHKELVKLKQNEVSWMYLSSKCAPQCALQDCDKAFQNFFTRCKKKIKGKKGFPKFKSKKNDKQSFRLNSRISVKSNYIKLPRIGKVRLKEKGYIPTNYKILSATISKKADKWFVSVNVEAPDKEKSTPTNKVVGVDLGVKTLATCSDGTSFENPKALKKNLNLLKRRQRQLARKKKGSNNREKAKKKLAKIHYRTSNIRKDSLHKITSEIIQKNNVIVLEDLKVSNMLKNRRLSQSISDVGLFEFRRQIEYKAKWHDRKVIFADTFYPSSKLCSSCNWKDENMTLSKRIFECKSCNLKIDRDLNASLNLKSLYTAGSAGIEACGDKSSIESENSKLSLSMKQEFNIGLQ